MKVFAISLLGIIFVILITSSVLPITADKSVDNKLSFADTDRLIFFTPENPKYEIHVQVLIRNVQGELISVAETLPCKGGDYCSEYFDHEVTDYAFDLLAKKETITINDVKYEKIQFSDSYSQTADAQFGSDVFFEDHSPQEPTGRWVVEVCGEALNEFGFECVQIFQSRTSIVWLEVGDVTTANWTVLKKIN